MNPGQGYTPVIPESFGQTPDPQQLKGCWARKHISCSEWHTESGCGLEGGHVLHAPVTPYFTSLTCFFGVLTSCNTTGFNSLYCLSYLWECWSCWTWFSIVQNGPLCQIGKRSWSNCKIQATLVFFKGSMTDSDSPTGCWSENCTVFSTDINLLVTLGTVWSEAMSSVPSVPMTPYFIPDSDKISTSYSACLTTM